VEVIPAGDTCFIATVFERAKGERVRAGNPEVWNAELFRNWGRTIGRMHALTKRYTVPDPAIKRPEWHEEELIVNAGRYLPPSETEALHAMRELSRRFLDAAPPGFSAIPGSAVVCLLFQEVRHDGVEGKPGPVLQPR
jgi:Ser/Thr protein kinase RdoA (MazF antagonist)